MPRPLNNLPGSDPIQTSSPAKQPETITIDSDSDADAPPCELDQHGHTVATLPLPRQRPTAPTGKISHLVAPISSSPPSSQPFVTQPTQLLGTPPRPRSIVQVPRTSPPELCHNTQLQSDLPLPVRPPPRYTAAGFAPPGTRLALPTSQRTAPSQFNDPPIYHSSDEDELAAASDIKPTKWSCANHSTSGRDDLSNTHPKVSTFATSRLRIDQFLHNPMPTSSISNASNKRPQSNEPLDSVTRPIKQLRQTGPSRALPVSDLDSVTINNILDYRVRDNVVCIRRALPEATITDCTDALFEARGNYESALAKVSDVLQARKEFYDTGEHLRGTIDTTQDGNQRPKGVASSFKRLSASSASYRPQVPPKAQSIASRYGHVASVSSSQGQGRIPSITRMPSVSTENSFSQTRKRRLKQGRRARDSSSPEPEVVDDSDSGIETLPNEHVPDEKFDDNVLNIINTSSLEDLMDLSESSEDIINLIIRNRPYRNLRAVQQVSMPLAPGKKRAPGMTAGERFLDTCTRMIETFKIIDGLAKNCRELGQPLADRMAEWGIDFYGSSSSGEGEMNVAFDDIKGDSDRDSGLGSTPSGTPPPTKGKGKATAKLVQQPASWSKDPAHVLKGYQIGGLNWLILLFKHKLSCILADDMGLGKTCQVIAFLTWLKEQGIKGPHMIIVQSSILENWLSEFKKFSPGLNVQPYHGTQSKREELRLLIPENLEEGGEECIDIIVTTYSMVENKDDSKFLRNLRPVAVVCDEGQILKNANSKKYLSLMKIGGQFRLLLSGTPVQNNLQELVALLRFILPDVFDEHMDDLSHIFKHKAKTSESDHAALLSARRIMRAREMMKPFVLRRKKEQVMRTLPPKTYTVVECDLHDDQKALYEEIRGGADVQVMMKNGEVQLVKGSTKNNLMLLQQAAIGRMMLRGYYDGDVIQEIAAKAVAGMSRYKNVDKTALMMSESWTDGMIAKLCYEQSHILGEYMISDELLMASGKLNMLLEILKKHAANGDRTLVFSKFTSALDIIEVMLLKNEIAFGRLDGSTLTDVRQGLIDGFNNKSTEPVQDVFLLSTLAGGTGINLATANKVVIFDCSFNPQQDIQAGNRAHRVGQTKPVDIITLITKGTIEEQIYALGKSKLMLDEQVGGEGKVERNGGSEKSATPVLLEEANVKKEDAKDAFLNGLKKAGLDMSAA